MTWLIAEMLMLLAIAAGIGGVLGWFLRGAVPPPSLRRDTPRDAARRAVGADPVDRPVELAHTAQPGDAASYDRIDPLEDIHSQIRHHDAQLEELNDALRRARARGDAEGVLAEIELRLVYHHRERDRLQRARSRLLGSESAEMSGYPHYS